MSGLAGDDVRGRLRRIVASVLEMDEGEVSAEALFYDDLGADSLEKVEIASLIGRDFGIRLTVAQAARMRSVEDAVALVAQAGAARPGIDLVDRLVGRWVAAGRAAAPAYQDPDLGEVSYGGLYEAVTDYAAVLLAAGVAPGARGLVIAEDSVATVVAVLGLWRAGCVPVMATPLSTDADLEFIARDCSAAVVHIDVAAARGERLAGLFGETLRLTGDEVRDRMRAGTDAGAPAVEVDAIRPGAADAEALVQYTSGSTGRPKGVRHAAGGIVAMLDGFGPVMGLREDDVVLSSARMSFGFGFGSSILCSLEAGACTALIRGAVDADVVAAAVQQYRPTVLCSVPRLYAALLERVRGGAAALSGLRLCVCAGERCPDALAERIAATLDADVMICLGATELMHVVLATRPSRLAPGSVGYPVPGVTVTVRDEKGQLVPDGSQGRLHIAGGNVALGYLNRPEEDAAVFADGGAYTNDIVARTADGAIEYICRADDMLNLGGYKVAPAEIEEVVRAVAGVADCRVVAAADEYGLEHAVVYAVAEPGASEARARRDVLAAVRRDLAAYKRPTRVEFLDALPLTTTGKVATFRLRDRQVRA